MTQPLFIIPRGQTLDLIDLDAIRRRLSIAIDLAERSAAGVCQRITLVSQETQPIADHFSHYRDASKARATSDTADFTVTVCHRIRHPILALDDWVGIHFKQRSNTLAFEIAEAKFTDWSNALRPGARPDYIVDRLHRFSGWLDRIICLATPSLEAEYHKAFEPGFEIASALIRSGGYPADGDFEFTFPSPYCDPQIFYCPPPYAPGFADHPVLTPAGQDFLRTLLPEIVALDVRRTPDRLTVGFGAYGSCLIDLHEFGGTHDILRTLSEANAPTDQPLVFPASP